jgi:hypothetical protein
VLDFGLPPPVAGRPPLLVEHTVDASGLLFYRAHGLGVDAQISFRAISSTTLGATPSSLGAPLVEGTTYYVRPTSSDAFQVALAPSPSAPITSFGAAVGRFGYVVDPGIALDNAIAKAWTMVQAQCTAHGGDVAAQILTDAAAAFAARLYVAVLCAGDPVKASTYDGISKLYQEVYEPLLQSYFRGLVVRGSVDATPASAENGARLMRPKHGPFRAPVVPFGSFGAFGSIDGIGDLGPRRDRV